MYYLKISYFKDVNPHFLRINEIINNCIIFVNSKLLFLFFLNLTDYFQVLNESVTCLMINPCNYFFL